MYVANRTVAVRVADERGFPVVPEDGPGDSHVLAAMSDYKKVNILVEYVGRSELAVNQAVVVVFEVLSVTAKGKPHSRAHPYHETYR